MDICVPTFAAKSYWTVNCRLRVLGAFILLTTIGAIAGSPRSVDAQTSQIAQALCDQGQQILLGNTLAMRRSGIPIETARNVMDTYLRTNVDFWRYMVGSVNALYKSPDAFVETVRDGKWKANCVSAVQGY